MCQKAHQNVFELVEVIKSEQAVVEMMISQLESGAQPRRRVRLVEEKGGLCTSSFSSCRNVTISLISSILLGEMGYSRAGNENYGMYFICKESCVLIGIVLLIAIAIANWK